MIKMGAIVLDSDNSEALSDFYAKLLGWKKEPHGSEWIVVMSENGEGTPLVFQEIENYRRPVWPAQPNAQQQMLHLDFYVDNVEESVTHAVACGARLNDVQLEKHWKVMTDPAGHTFCILPNKPPKEE